MRIVCGDGCAIDTDRRQVFRGDREVSLSPKAYELLALLIEARPNAVSKDTLYQQLWPGTFVVPANLPNLVSEIRAALGDSGRHPRIIRTLHRFGYAFAGAPEVARPAIYWLRWGMMDLPLREGENTIGRDQGNHVRLDAAGVSRRHARVMIEGGRLVIEDLHSKNGTFVRGTRINGPRTLSPGDDVAFGSVYVTVQAMSADASTDSMSR
jgi:DNA-binding winged helix-turn-helix (wHTH) protein